MTPIFDRRRFIGLSGGLVAGLLWGSSAGTRAEALQGPERSTKAGSIPDRTLVVVDLEGGNDALNTLVPPDPRYHDLRPTIGLADDELLTWDGLDLGVHPSLASLTPIWNQGLLAAFLGVGLPGQTRSHFVAQDAWRSAMPGVPATSGWLGRWLEMTAPEDPEAEIPLRAISLGRDTLAAKSESGRPVAIQSVDAYELRPPSQSDAVIDALVSMGEVGAGGLLGAARASLPATVASVEQLQGIIAGATGNDDEVGPDPSAALFSAAASIIQADVGTQVLYLTVDGFDTHAGQLPRHRQLLATVADGIAGLFDGLTASGHADRTLVLTVSEFGRRAAENGSAGTDHGNGSVAFMAGPAVAGGRTYGALDLGDLVDGDLPLAVDTRSVYDVALDWLGGGEGVIDGDRTALDVLR